MGLIDKITTPNDTEKALRVLVPSEKVIPRHEPVASVTRYADFKMHPAPNRAEGYADYVFTYCGDTLGATERDSASGPLDQSWVPYYFAANKTDAQMRTPFRSFMERMGNKRWPDILVALGVQADYAFPRSATVVSGNDQGIVTAPNYRIAEALIPEMNEGTRFMVQEFQGPRPFTIPRYRVPVPRAVSITLPDGTRYRHPECLGGEIVIDPLSTADVTLISGTGTPVGGTLGEQRIPASNFQRWLPYWFSDEQVLKNGVWYRRRVRVIPPFVPAAMFLLN